MLVEAKTERAPDTPTSVDALPDRVLVTDFGLSRISTHTWKPIEVATASGPDGSAELRRTQAGRIVGTPAYMAAEQLLNSTVGARADIFSFGVCLYEALSGRRPYVGATFAELVAELTRGTPRMIDAPKVPTWVKRLVMRAVAADPAARFASMGELLAKLRVRLHPATADGGIHDLHPAAVARPDHKGP